MRTYTHEMACSISRIYTFVPIGLRITLGGDIGASENIGQTPVVERPDY